MNKAQELQIDWQWYPFGELTVEQLSAVYQLRQNVFIVEQNCPYLDADGKDKDAIHLLGLLNGELVATLRYFPGYPDYDNQASIGRVCTAKKVRCFGVGREMMGQAIDFSDRHYADKPCQIGAQAYLKKFYQSFGFEQVSEEYLEDDIPHILMRRNARLD